MDGRQNPKRLKVAPPPGGKRPGDWKDKAVVTKVSIGEHPAGSEALVFCGSHGGSGLAIRFSDGSTCGGITESHVHLADVVTN